MNQCMKYFFQSIVLGIISVLCSTHSVAAPGDILYENNFDLTSSLTNDYDRSSSTAVAITPVTYQSAPASAFLRSGPQSMTLKAVNAINANVPSAQLDIWVQRGSDLFSENPDNGEDLRIEYLSSGNSWIILEDFPGGGTPGEIFDRTYDLPADALHSGLRFRFRTLDGNLWSDYWHIDDVVVTETQPPTALVAHWQLEEATWNGASNQILDVSGNNFHGFSVAPTGSHPLPEISDPAISGASGTCGYGNFSGANGGFLQINDPGGSFDLDIPDALTVTVWIQPRSIPVSDLQTIVSKDENYEFHINTAGQIYWWWGGGAQELGTTGLPLVPDGSWYHIAITYTDGLQKIYINGQERASGTTTGTLTLNNDPVLIGTDLGFNNRTFDGLIDEVKIYHGALSQSQIQTVMAETHVCPIVGVDHYAISVDGGVSFSDGSGITCEASNVTVIAHDASNAAMSPGTGTTIYLSTSTNNGYWSSADVGTITDTGSGTATYTFDNNSQATLRFNHTQVAINPNAVNFNINAGNGDPGEAGGEDPSLEFFEAGFRFVDAVDNPVIANQIAAQTSANFSLQAIRTDTQTGQCVNVFGNGDRVNLELAAECNNPSSCAGLQLSVTNDGNTTSIATNNDNGAANAASYSTVSNVLFSADSKAQFTLNYPDAGAMSLHARYQIVNDDGSLSGDYLLGSSNSFVVRPADFVITSAFAGAVNNPATTNAGSGFVAAGDPFTVVVQARNAIGNVTPNFGNEVSPETVQLALDSLVFPVGGNIGALTNSAAFSATGNAGEFENTSVSWNEVGSVSTIVNLADGDYLGAGNVASLSPTTLGRFYPAYFLLQSSSVSNSCSAGNFSYFSHDAIPVSYEIAAKNRAGSTVINYDNTDLTYSVSTITLHGENNNDGNDLSNRLSVANTQWDDGEWLVVDTAASLDRLQDGSLNTIPDGPFNNVLLGVSINDIDAVNFETLNFNPNDNADCITNGNCDSIVLSGSLQMRFGQLRLSDVHGPETAAIPMIWQTEYWNGNTFIENSDDSCTQLPLTDVNFVGATSTVDGINDNIGVDLGGALSIFNFSDPNGVLDCLSPTAIGFCNGRAGIAYGATGQVVTYPIDIDLTNHPHLQGDWNQDGNYSDSSHPRTYVRFQNYRGHDRVIYWQENLQ